MRITRRVFYRGAIFYQGCRQMTVEEWLEKMLFLKQKPFKQRVADLRPKVYKYALSITQDKTEAEDLTQDALIKAMLSEEKYKEGYLLAWICVITKRIFTDQYRKSAKMKTNGLEGVNISISPDAEVNLMRGDLEKTIGKMSPAVSDAISQRIAGKRYNEIAKDMKRHLTTVKVDIKKARIALEEMR